MKWKPYHQCLTRLGRTLELTTSMPSREYVGYYKLLLRGVKVEAGQTNKAYAVLLNEAKKHRYEELEPIPVEEGLEPGNADGIIVLGPPQRPAPKRVRVDQPPPSGTARSSRDPPPQPIAGPPRDPSPGVGGGGGNSDGIIQPAVAPPPDGIMVPQGTPATDAPLVRLPPDWVDGLDGCKVSYKDYTNRRTGKRYVNFKLLCPRHPDAEPPCVKTKGEAPKLMEALGPSAPWFFAYVDGPGR